jgi:hypothetical protein
LKWIQQTSRFIIQLHHIQFSLILTSEFHILQAIYFQYTTQEQDRSKNQHKT